jgi:hypothetical protein
LYGRGAAVLRGDPWSGRRPGVERVVVPPLGLEPRTHGLKVRCSTN